MAFNSHRTRHREPKGFKVKSNAASRERQPASTSHLGCREWIEHRKAQREARPLVRLARLFGRQS